MTVRYVAIYTQVTTVWEWSSRLLDMTAFLGEYGRIQTKFQFLEYARSWRGFTLTGMWHLVWQDKWWKGSSPDRQSFIFMAHTNIKCMPVCGEGNDKFGKRNKTWPWLIKRNAAAVLVWITISVFLAMKQAYTVVAEKFPVTLDIVSRPK